MLVSVIIPCFNVEDYVEECVNSVLNQTHSELEIICIDNNSTDRTAQILTRIARLDSRIKVAFEERAGAASARNKGVELALGEWIQFLDADDLLESTKIAHQLAITTGVGNDCGFVAGAWWQQGLDGSLREKKPAIQLPQAVSVFSNSAGNTCSNLWRRKAIRSVSAWDTNLHSSQEADLMMRMHLKGWKYVADLTPLTTVRERPSGQISQGDPSQRLVRYLDVRMNYLKGLETVHNNEFHLYRMQLLDFLMITVLMLWRVDREQATAYFSKISRGWIPQGHFGMSRVKAWLLKMFGLRACSWIIR